MLLALPFLSAYFSLVPQSNAQQNLLKSRVDTNFRHSDQRALVVTEFWHPLFQDRNWVLYADLRLMGDDQENREGNLGLGFRRCVEAPLLGEGVVGLHGWLDRRTTLRNSHFYQTTLGFEWLGERLDILANGYLPLSFAKTHVLPNAAPQGNLFAGTGIVVDADGTTLEEPQHGVDLELGWQLPWMQALTDSFRVYGGGYYFDGEHTPHLSGWRTRLVADITPDLQVGARFQEDERGFLAFVETTVRFPFGQKRSFRRQGRRARLDDSPQRDVDIITNEAVVTNWGRTPILNKSTDAEQVVLHVDNSASAGGDGSVASPYNTLAAAAAAAGAESIIYVHQGLGSSTGQDLGITLDNTGQQLLGSGTDFLIDPQRMTTAAGTLPSSLLVAPATSAPVLTNTGGNGVTITADNVTVAGLKIENATDHGIFIDNANQTTVRDVALDGNGNATGDDGIYASYSGNGNYQMTLTRNTITNSQEEGLTIETLDTSIVDAMIAENTIASSGRYGVYLLSQNSSKLTATLSGNTISNNGSYGVYLLSQNSSNLTGTLSGNTISNNSVYGVYLRSQGNSTLTGTFSGNTISGNSHRGVLLHSQDSSNLTGTLTQNTISGNASDGAYLLSQSSSTLTGTFSGNTISGNSARGVYLQSQSSSTLTGTLSGNTISGNASDGAYLLSQNSSNLTGTLSGNTISNNSVYGAYLLSQNSSNLTGTLSGNTISNNSVYGVYAIDTSSLAMQADLGGGSLGSAGNNSIFGNSLQEVRVDLAGALLKAENNWWGDPLGLTPAETFLESGTTIDADPYLSTAP